jgi:very-short-patch-repair endonuclease
MKLPFHQEARPKIFDNAQSLRKEMTEAEKLLWKILRNRRFHNLKFRRQHPVLSYVTDFYCHDAKLIVEVDGKVHNEKNNAENDKERTAQLAAQGLLVLRFTNEEIMHDISGVLIKIENHLLKNPTNHPSPPRRGDGGEARGPGVRREDRG